jgi:sugar phosphate permease
VIGAALIVLASVSFMLGLNLAGIRYPWLSAPILTLFACAVVMGVFFVLRLTRAPEPLIPIAILKNPIVRWAAIANAFGWGSIIGLNIFLPMYLQSVIGLTPTDAGLSLMVLMVALNSSAGLAGQVLGRVKHYKLLPMCAFTVSIASVLALALWADRLTLLQFELLLLLIGAGFGPMPSLASVSVQNTVPRHQLGISLGTVNFSRQLVSTMMIALLGAIILSVTSQLGPGAGGRFGGSIPPDAAEAAEAFRRMFFAVAACLSLSFVALVMIEERPLGSDHPEKP